MNETASFAELTKQCVQKLCIYLGEKKLDLTPEHMTWADLQAEITASYIQHTHGETSFLPREDEMVNFSLRAKYGLDCLPEIQQELMNQGAKSPHRSYPIADRLASIEGRFYFESLRRGAGPLFIPHKMPKKSSHNLIQGLKQRHLLSDPAVQHCEQ